MKKVNVKGSIIPTDDAWIYDYFGIEHTSPRSVSAELNNANGEEIEVEINSGGGSVFAGSEIYTALKSYSGKVTVKIVGLAASAASVIAMAGDKVLMSPTAQMMVHNVSSRSSGDYRDMEHTAEVLKNANQTIANAYALKTNMDNETLLGMMDKETWFTAQQAKEKGFVDEIMFDNNNNIQMVASIGNATLLPLEVINKMRNTLKNSLEPQKNEADISMLENIEIEKIKLFNIRRNLNV